MRIIFLTGGLLLLAVLFAGCVEQGISINAQSQGGEVQASANESTVTEPDDTQTRAEEPAVEPEAPEGPFVYYCCMKDETNFYSMLDCGTYTPIHFSTCAIYTECQQLCNKKHPGMIGVESGTTCTCKKIGVLPPAPKTTTYTYWCCGPSDTSASLKTTECAGKNDDYFRDITHCLWTPDGYKKCQDICTEKNPGSAGAKGSYDPYHSCECTITED